MQLNTSQVTGNYTENPTARAQLLLAELVQDPYFKGLTPENGLGVLEARTRAALYNIQRDLGIIADGKPNPVVIFGMELIRNKMKA